jgi:hypothetical protein
MVRETDWDEISSNPEMSPIPVFTSNQERNLPEAFLRRCIFRFCGRATALFASFTLSLSFCVMNRVMLSITRCPAR